MYRNKKLHQLGFWGACLAIVMHVLLFFAFNLILDFKSNVPQRHVQSHYVPAYMYAPPALPQFANKQTANESTVKSIIATKPATKSLIASSFHWLAAQQMQTIAQKSTKDPILLVGKETDNPDPLISALGKALSAHFYYPKNEGIWGIRGQVIVEMNLYPDGHFSDVQIIKSSSNHNLDMAALYAVNSAPLVENAHHYLAKPKHIVVRFGFN